MVEISELIPEQVEIWKKMAAQPKKKGWFSKKGMEFTTLPEGDLPIHVRSFINDARTISILEDMPLWGQAFSREELIRIFPKQRHLIAGSSFITYGEEEKVGPPPSLLELGKGAGNSNLAESLASFSRAHGMLLHELQDENISPEGRLSRNTWVSILDGFIWITEGLIEDDDGKIAKALPALELGRSFLQEEYYPLKRACEAYIAFDDEERKMLVKETIQMHRSLPGRGPAGYMIAKIVVKIKERKGVDYITVGGRERGREEEKDRPLPLDLASKALTIESNTEALKMLYEAHKGVSDMLGLNPPEKWRSLYAPWPDIIESNIATIEGIMTDDNDRIQEALVHMTKGRHVIGKWYVSHKAACEAYITDEEEERLRLFKAAILSSDAHDPDSPAYHFLRKILRSVADKHDGEYTKLFEGMRKEESYVPSD